MFDLTGMTALVTGASGGIGSAIAEALAGQGARLAVSGSNVDKLEAFRAGLGGDHVALACNLSDGAAVDALVPQAVEALGAARHPRQQCRSHPRQSRHADEGRGMVRRHPDQPRGRLPPRPRGAEADDARPLRPDHLDHLGGRRDRQSRPGQLCRVQGGPGRHVQGAGPGGREPRHHRQLHRAGLHPLGDDRRACPRRRRRPCSAASRPAGSARGTTSPPPPFISPAARPATSPARPCT